MSKPTIQELYDREVEKFKMFIDCGYTEYKDKQPTLPAFTSLGGYPIYYLDGNNMMLCAKCATESLIDPEEYDDFKPQHFGIYYEGSDMYCDICNAVIESAYGNPFAE